MKRVTYMSATKLPMAIIIYYIEFNPTKLSCLLKLWPKELKREGRLGKVSWRNLIITKVEISNFLVLQRVKLK